MPHSPLSAVVRHIRDLAERTSAATLSDRHLLESFIKQRVRVCLPTEEGGF